MGKERFDQLHRTREQHRILPCFQKLQHTQNIYFTFSKSILNYDKTIEQSKAYYDFWCFFLGGGGGSHKDNRLYAAFDAASNCINWMLALLVYDVLASF